MRTTATAVAMNRKRRPHESPALLASAQRKKIGGYLILPAGVPTPQPRLFTAAEVKKQLQLSPCQREQIREEVNELVVILRAGGLIPDPIHVTHRPDGGFYIVDGQQRYWAHWACELPIRALVYKLPGDWTPDQCLNAERVLFSILNRAKAIGPDAKVKGWAGPAGQLLRDLNSNLASPLAGKVNLAQTFNGKYPASVIVKALVTLCSGGQKVHTRLDDSLMRLDMVLVGKDRDAVRARVDAFVAMIPDVFPHRGGMRILSAIGLARVAEQRWRQRVVPPSPGTLKRLARTPWPSLMASSSVRFLPVVEAEIQARWPERGES